MENITITLKKEGKNYVANCDLGNGTVLMEEGRAVIRTLFLLARKLSTAIKDEKTKKAE